MKNSKLLILDLLCLQNLFLFIFGNPNRHPCVKLLFCMMLILLVGLMFRSSTPTSSRTAPVMATPSPARPAKPKTVTKSHNKPGLFTSPRPNRLTSAQEAAGGAKVSTRSPSRMVQPKRYSLVGTTTPTSATPTSARARTPTNRVAVTAPNTPKRQAVAPSPR